jgi:hypothetical protein
VIGALVLIIVVACLIIIFFAIRQRKAKKEIPTAREDSRETQPEARQRSGEAEGLRTSDKNEMGLSSDEGLEQSIPKPISKPSPQGPLCPTCGNEYEPSRNTCNYCGSKIKKTVKKIKQGPPKSIPQPVLQETLCSQCFTALDPKWTMCPECGLDLEKKEVESKLDVSDDAPEPVEKK